jgi:hypothetical protein
MKSCRMGFFSVLRNRKTVTKSTIAPDMAPFSDMPPPSFFADEPSPNPHQTRTPDAVLLQRFSEQVGDADDVSGWAMPLDIERCLEKSPYGADVMSAPTSPVIDHSWFENAPVHGMRGGNMDGFDDCDPNDPEALAQYLDAIEDDAEFDSLEARIQAEIDALVASNSGSDSGSEATADIGRILPDFPSSSLSSSDGSSLLAGLECETPANHRILSYASFQQLLNPQPLSHTSHFISNWVNNIALPAPTPFQALHPLIIPSAHWTIPPHNAHHSPSFSTWAELYSAYARGERSITLPSPQPDNFLQRSDTDRTHWPFVIDATEYSASEYSQAESEVIDQAVNDRTDWVLIMDLSEGSASMSISSEDVSMQDIQCANAPSSYSRIPTVPFGHFPIHAPFPQFGFSPLLAGDDDDVDDERAGADDEVEMVQRYGTWIYDADFVFGIGQWFEFRFWLPASMARFEFVFGKGLGSEFTFEVAGAL